MLDPVQYQRLLLAMPRLEQAEEGLLRDLRQQAFFARIPAGRDVFLEGGRVEAIAILIAGVVRVYKVGENGREITLYRFGNGQSCILSANAILSQREFPAVATVEQDAEAVMIPAPAFQDWVRRYDVWRDFVFQLLSERLTSVMAVVEEVAFRRMDSRLAAFLLDHDRQGDPIQMTHQEIAAELGTSREVISRILEDLAAEGAVQVGRGAVQVLDRSTLRTRAAV